MKVVIVCLLSLFVTSCLAIDPWRNEIVVSARKLSRPLDIQAKYVGNLFGETLAKVCSICRHVALVVTTNAGRSHLIHNTKPQAVVITDWERKFPGNWQSEEITVGKKGLTVQQVFNAMWGGNFKRAVGDGKYSLSEYRCDDAVWYGTYALQGDCNPTTGTCPKPPRHALADQMKQDITESNRHPFFPFWPAFK